MRYTILLISIFMFSCHKENESIIDSPAKASFHATINGNKISVTENDKPKNNDSSIYCNPSVSKRLGPIDKTIYSIESFLGSPLNDSLPRNSISVDFVNHLTDAQIDSDGVVSRLILDEIFSLGSKSYSGNFMEQSGILIEWYDSNRHRWTTNKYMSVSNLTTIPGNPNLTNSSFKIVKSLSVNPTSQIFKYAQYLEIEFNCNLYDEEGDSIKMANAYFNGIFSIYKH